MPLAGEAYNYKMEDYMLKVGFVGWRGMVGSVLMERMQQEKDFDGIESHFFSTSQAGQKTPDYGQNGPDTLADAHDITLLQQMDAVVTCQGGGYTEKIYPEIRKSGWKGYWIDAASTLRMNDDSIIILDPVNRHIIDKALSDEGKLFVGGNCTVSLMLMAVGGLFRQNLVEWLSSMTYQAASGAGAKNMKELVAQMKSLGEAGAEQLDPATAILDLDRTITATLRDESFPASEFGAPLAGSLLPWIDRAMDDGRTREEWKGYAETNKILMNDPAVPIDGICVRVGAMRSHSQAFTIKLKKDAPMDELEDIIRSSSDWTRFVSNEKDATLRQLTPAAASGTLDVPVGRVRKMKMGSDFLAAFSVGDQLLWGAAEPLRRMLNILREHLGK